jgi:hypothetical protein
MSGRVLTWAGGVVFVAAVAGMGVYFTRVGLAQADQSASVIGAFVGVAGLALSLFGVLAERRHPTSTTSDASADPGGAVAPRRPGTGSGDTRNAIKGGTFHGPVTLGRDITGPPPPHGSPPPADPDA